MKDKKDISDLIHHNQHKLEERPSQRTWKRLESKLDTRRSRGNSFLYRHIAMAAAVVALVAVISLIIVLADKKSSQFAKADEANPFENWIVQDLETVYTDATTNVRFVVEFQKQLRERYTNPIQEGIQTKKLVIYNNNLTGSVNPSRGVAKEMLAMKENKKGNAPQSTPQEETAARILSELDDSSPVEDVQVILESEDESTPSALAKKESKLKSEDPISKWLTTTQQMEWILGEWREGNSIHEIQKVNMSTILCDDFILKDKRNSGLHFMDTKSQQSYALVSDKDNKKVFSNKNSDRIILENINPTKFTITFLPAEGVEEMRIFTK